MKAPWAALGPRRPRCIDRGVAGRDPSRALLFTLSLALSFALLSPRAELRRFNFNSY